MDHIYGDPHISGSQHTSACCVYPVEVEMALKHLITDHVHWHLQNKPEAPMLIVGGFNHCLLDTSVPGTYIKASYTAGVRPPPEDSDHNMIQLLPTF